MTVPSIRRLATLSLVLLGAVLVPVEPAAASCLPPEDPRITLARADAAFIGELVSRRSSAGVESPRGEIFVFRVRESVKGGLGQVVEVRDEAPSSSVGLSAEPGQEVGLFLRRRGGRFAANDCDRISPGQLRVARRGGPAVKEATTPAVVSFRLRGRRLTVTVARDAPRQVRRALRRRLTFFCGSFAGGGRNAGTATARFRPGARRVRLVLSRDVFGTASFCGVRHASGDELARAFFFSRG